MSYFLGLATHCDCAYCSFCKRDFHSQAIKYGISFAWNLEKARLGLKRGTYLWNSDNYKWPHSFLSSLLYKNRRVDLGIQKSVQWVCRLNVSLSVRKAQKENSLPSAEILFLCGLITHASTIPSGHGKGRGSVFHLITSFISNLNAVLCLSC